MTYSYGNEPIDWRTLALQNARPGTEDLFVPKSPEQMEEENFKLTQQLQQLTGMNPDAMKVAYAQPFEVAQSSQVKPTDVMPGFSSIEEALTNQPVQPANGSKKMAMPTGKTADKTPAIKKEDTFSWKSVLDLLERIAQHELTGSVIYTVLSNCVTGIYGEVVKEKLATSSDEGKIHFTSAVEMIKRLDLTQIGGLTAVQLVPSSEKIRELSEVIKPTGVETVMPALIWAITFEREAIVLYSQLSELICGHDEALENWALTQIEEETRHALRFEELAGLK